MPILRSGMSKFLLHYFMKENNDAKLNTATNLIQDLPTFPEVGKIIYNRQHSHKPPSNTFLQMTIMQLLASKIIELVISDNKPVVVFSLSIQ